MTRAPWWPRLQWQLRHVLRAVGLAGWVGIGLLAACTLGWWLATAPMRADAAALDVASAALQARLTARQAASAAVPSSPLQQMAEFQRRFGVERDIVTALARLQAAGKRQGVQLDRAEFRFASDAAEPLLRYTMVLPVKADYLALRHFMRDALLELPGLAIEEVSLRRTDPKSTLVEAQLRLVLFLAKSS